MVAAAQNERVDLMKRPLKDGQEVRARRNSIAGGRSLLGKYSRRVTLDSAGKSKDVQSWRLESASGGIVLSLKAKRAGPSGHAGRQSAITAHRTVRAARNRRSREPDSSAIGWCRTETFMMGYRLAETGRIYGGGLQSYGTSLAG